VAVSLNTKRFILREITEKEVTEQYLAWFNDEEAINHICFAADKKSLNELKSYVCERINREDILFLAIFDKALNIHVGNIKYEPISINEGYAIMGIFIGEKEYRGMGVTKEVFECSSRWLKDNRNIKYIYLGVDVKNKNAIKAYEKSGFCQTKTHLVNNGTNQSIAMVFNMYS
jgi:RimJ/RimL family protein N-acetyltransferase